MIQMKRLRTLGLACMIGLAGLAPATDSFAAVTRTKQEGIYTGSAGKTFTGWHQDSSNSKWYYFNANGEVTVGWVKDAGKWYYMNTDGVMVTGWLKLG